MSDICKNLNKSKPWYYETLASTQKVGEYEQMIVGEVVKIRAAHPAYGIRKRWKPKHRKAPELIRGLSGWDERIRTPINGARDRCPTIERHPIIIWLGREDSNPRMAGPKPAALPLGDCPFQYLAEREGFEPSEGF